MHYNERVKSIQTQPRLIASNLAVFTGYFPLLTNGIGIGHNHIMTQQKPQTALEKARAVADKIKAENEASKTEKIAAETNQQLKPTTPQVQTGKQFGRFTIRKAERSQAKLRIGLAGASGSGKTYSALLLAKGLAGSWEDVAIIDTENGSADLYSHLGAYNVLTLEKPFSPDRYMEAIKAAEEAGVKVIIIDSITHEWSGQGGALEMQEKLGGRFQDWAKVTPVHNRFVQTMLQSPAHIITCVRSKTDYAMSTEGGKSKVQKVGLKPEQRDGLEYEMTVSFTLNINNMAEVSKDRTGLFKNDVGFVITEETGKELAEWAYSGIDYVKRVRELLKQKGKTETPIFDTFKVLSLDDLSPAQYKAAITKLETLPDYDPNAEKPETAPQNAKTETQHSTPPTANEPETPKAQEQDTTPATPPQPEQPQQEEIDVDEVDAGIEQMRVDQQKEEKKGATFEGH